jgi:hypothetical protein
LKEVFDLLWCNDTLARATLNRVGQPSKEKNHASHFIDDIFADVPASGCHDPGSFL